MYGSIGIKEKTPQQQQRNAPPQKSGLLRQTLTVPDFSGPDITISTPIIADSVEPLTSPLSAEEQRANPIPSVARFAWFRPQTRL